MAPMGLTPALPHVYCIDRQVHSRGQAALTFRILALTWFCSIRRSIMFSYFSRSGRGMYSRKVCSAA